MNIPLKMKFTDRLFCGMNNQSNIEKKKNSRINYKSNTNNDNHSYTNNLALTSHINIYDGLIFDSLFQSGNLDSAIKVIDMYKIGRINVI